MRGLELGVGLALTAGCGPGLAADGSTTSETATESIESDESEVPACSEILDEDVWVQSAADMAALANVVEIYGELHIVDHDAVELVGANCLETIHGRLELVALGELQRVDQAFTRLRAIEPFVDEGQPSSGLFVSQNFNLVSLAGFAALERVEGRVQLVQNNALAQLPFESLERIGGDVELGSHALVDLTGLASLREIGGRLTIRDFPQLVDLDGLQGLELLGGLLLGPDVASLTSLDGLELDSIGDLHVQTTPLTNLAGLESLTTLTGDLTILANPNLVSLAGLDNLVELIDGGSLENVVIAQNPALTSLDGLAALEVVPDRLLICDNDALADLSGLASLSAATHVSILYNASSSDAEGLALAAAIPGLEQIKVDANGPLAPMWWDKPECPWVGDQVCDETSNVLPGQRGQCWEDCCALYGPTHLCAPGTDVVDCGA